MIFLGGMRSVFNSQPVDFLSSNNTKVLGIQLTRS